MVMPHVPLFDCSGLEEHFATLFLLTWQCVKGLMPVLSTDGLTLNSRKY